MTGNIEDILDECIDRIVLKGEDVEECVKDYADSAAELKPLLEVAQAITKAASVQPRADFKANLLYRLESGSVRKQTPSPLLLWSRRFAPVAAALVLVFALGSGTINAAAGSLPGEALYPVKMATENFRLVLTPSQTDRAMLQVEFADNRVHEIEALSSSSGANPEIIGDLALRVNYHLSAVEEAAYSDPRFTSFTEKDRMALRMILERNAARHQAVLQQVLERAPEAARAAIQQALMVSQRGYEEAIRVSRSQMNGQGRGSDRNGVQPAEGTLIPYVPPGLDKTVPSALENESPGMGMESGRMGMGEMSGTSPSK